MHGRPWLPWQRSTADLIGQRKDNGRMAWPIGVILVPRQCGKTTFIFDNTMGRCLTEQDYRAAYTAQTGHVTTERFAERMAELGGTPLARRIRARRSQGTERMTFPGGSFLKAFPPRDGALRGSALDDVTIDEAQEIDELQGIALDQTILPTFTTRPRRQLVLIGTAGTESSKYLARYLALARGGAAGVALVEYGATDDDDPTDPAVWWRVHPGLAAGLTDVDALHSALAVMGVEGFAREYLNVWQDTGVRIIPARQWIECRRVKARPGPAAPVIAVEVAYDRSAAVIVAVWPDAGDRCPVIEVVHYAPGTGWAAPMLAELFTKHRPPLIGADSQGPVLTVVDELRRLTGPGGRPAVPADSIVQTTTKEYGTACAQLLDRINAGTVAHRGDKALDAAVAGAAKRAIGDGGWAWGRRVSTADVGPLSAASIAVWLDSRRPTAPGRPVVTSQ